MNSNGKNFNFQDSELDAVIRFANSGNLPGGFGDEFTPFSGSNDSPYQLSAVNTTDYDIFALQPIDEGTSKGKAKNNDGPKKYIPAESLTLARVYVDTSEDAILGNYQNSKMFWDRIAEKYNAVRPKGRPERDGEMLRKHWGRLLPDVQKFGGLYANVARTWPSGSNADDIMCKAKDLYYEAEKKVFKFQDVWKILQKSPKFNVGADARGSGPKQSKLSDTGSYSTSGGGHSIDLNATGDDFAFGSGDEPIGPSRPMGTKAAKKAKGKANKTSPSMPPPPAHLALEEMNKNLANMTLALHCTNLTKLMAKDTSGLSETELKMHHDMIALLHGIISRSNA